MFSRTPSAKCSTDDDKWCGVVASFGTVKCCYKQMAEDMGPQKVCIDDPETVTDCATGECQWTLGDPSGWSQVALDTWLIGQGLNVDGSIVGMIVLQFSILATVHGVLYANIQYCI